MTAKTQTTASNRQAGPLTTAIVVELGRSAGSAPVAAGIAMARARQLDGAGWVLLAELDPRGGDLLERLALGKVPRARFDDDRPPPGARHLAEHLASLEFADGLAGDPVSTLPALSEHLVEVAGVPGVRVLLGDHLVHGASRAATVITPWLTVLAETARASAIVIDGGAWTSGEPDRLATADIVYAVIQASSASQNARCLAELTAMWRLLQTRERPGRLVGVVVDPVHNPDELRELFEAGDTQTPGRPGYRVVVLAGRNDRRVLTRLGTGQWRGLPDKTLQPFLDLASPLRDQPTTAGPQPTAAPAEPVDEHAYLTTSAEPAEAPTPEHLNQGEPVDTPDPSFWPFDDGDLLIVDETTCWGSATEIAAQQPDHEQPPADPTADPEHQLPPKPTHRYPDVDTAGGGAELPEEWEEQLSPAVRAALELSLGAAAPAVPPRRWRGGPRDGVDS